MGSSINQTTARVHVWDLPVRIFHWSLVAAVVTAITTAEIGGDWMELHGKAGLAIIGLLAFRITWGVVGSTHARFANFAPTPAKIRSYLAGRWQGVGHNPLGALAVFGLLGLLAAQAATGLFSSDDIAFNGPLFSFVDQSVADRLTGYHHWLSNVLFALLGLHVGAILFYAVVKRNNLVIPMLTGWTVAHSPKPARKGSVFALVLSIAIAAVAVYGASSAGAAVHAPAAVPAPVASETATAAPAASAPAASATRTTAAW